LRNGGFELLSSRLGTPDAAGRCLFSQLPPGFPVVPQYLGHTSVVPQPLTEPDKRLSHIRLFTQTFSFGLNGFKNSSTGGKGQKYLFSGLVKCGQCEGNYVVTSRYQYGCSTRINRGTVVCDNGIRVSRELLERILLARIKEDLLCPEGIELFLKETQRLLQQTPNPTQDLGKQVRQTEKEIQNVLKAIKAGIFTESTEAKLRRLEAKKKELESLLHEKNGGFLNGHQFIPAARACFHNLVKNLENVEAAGLPPIREQIKTLVGGQIKLHPTAQGHLEAEFTGDYASFLKLTGEKSKIMVVAGVLSI